jgi:hypothetical protein
VGASPHHRQHARVFRQFWRIAPKFDITSHSFPSCQTFNSQLIGYPWGTANSSQSGTVEQSVQPLRQFYLKSTRLGPPFLSPSFADLLFSSGRIPNLSDCHPTFSPISSLPRPPWVRRRQKISRHRRARTNLKADLNTLRDESIHSSHRALHGCGKVNPFISMKIYKHRSDGVSTADPWRPEREHSTATRQQAIDPVNRQEPGVSSANGRSQQQRSLARFPSGEMRNDEARQALNPAAVPFQSPPQSMPSRFQPYVPLRLVFFSRNPLHWLYLTN